MASTPLLRPATRDDADAIARLHAASWRKAYAGIFKQSFLDHDADANRLKAWRARLSDPAPNQHVTLATTDTGLAGFICVFAKEDDEWGSLIDNLHVSPEMTGHGVGRALMGHGAAWLNREFGDDPVHLWVLEGNTGARRFYSALGGQDAGVLERMHPDGQMLRACRVTWPMPAAITA